LGREKIWSTGWAVEGEELGRSKLLSQLGRCCPRIGLGKKRKIFRDPSLPSKKKAEERKKGS